MADRPIMIIDGMNYFIRYYCANPTMDANGEMVGGVIGFIKAVTALIKINKPEQVYVIWEAGGSQRRRAIYPDYKKGRKPPRTNRTYGDAIPDTEENRAYQIVVLTKLLRCLPLCQVYVEKCEADDIIGYLCNEKFSRREKIIVSSDKDFYQLLDDTTRMWSPGKRIFYTADSVTTEYNISPNNFATARAFDGDKSDNIPGVERVGLKTLAKKFDLVGEDVTIDQIIEISKEEAQKKKPLKIHENIAISEDLVKRNYKLMKLNSSMLSLGQIVKTNDIIDDFIPRCSKLKFLRRYMKYSLTGIDCDNVCTSLYPLVLQHTEEKKEEAE